MLSYKAFFTHNWGTRRPDGTYEVHSRVMRIGEGAKSRGVSIWLDTERMTGMIVKQMCDGIDQSECVVVFITREYMRKVAGDDASDNCQKEFMYAELKKTSRLMLAVVLEPECRNTREWYGPVGMALGSSLYVDFSNDENFDAKIDQLCDEIAKRTGGIATYRVVPAGTGGKIYDTVKNGDLDELTRLVEEWAGNDVLNWSEPEDGGRTPLQIACQDNLEMVLLLTRTPGVDVNRATGVFGSSPLMVACCFGQVEVVDALLKLPHVDVNHKGIGDGTALMCAVCPRDTSNRLDIVRMLLAVPGIDVNVVATDGAWKGHTALGLALINDEDDPDDVKADLKTVAALLRLAGSQAKSIPGGRRCSIGH